MDSSMDEVFAKHLSAAREEIASAQAMIDAGRAKITEGQEQVLAGEAAADAAQTRLAVVEDLIAKVRRDLDAVGGTTTETTAATTTETASDTSAGSTAPIAPLAQSNGGRSMGPVMDEIMSDGEERTIDQIHATMEDRGYSWSRASVMNRCADRAKRGFYVRRVREDGKSVYRLAANSGDKLPSGSANPEGGREPQPEEGSQYGTGDAEGAGSLAI